MNRFPSVGNSTVVLEFLAGACYAFALASHRTAGYIVWVEFRLRFDRRAVLTAQYPLDHP